MRASRCIRCLLAIFTLGSGILLEARGKEAWVEVRSPHFVAYCDAGEAEARKALKGFEGIRSVFQFAFPGIQVEPHRPMIIIVVADEASMKRFLPEHFAGRDPKRLAGLFQLCEDRQYAILRADAELQGDQTNFSLFHEYTHSIIHQNFPALPTWLDEGIADFYGSTEIRTDQVYIGRVAVGRLRELRESVRLPIETLLTVTQDSPYYREGDKAGIFYAQSWAFVHYLLMDKDAKQAGLFQSYLKALAGTTDPLAVAREGFGDLAALQGAMNSYANRSFFNYWTLPLAVKLDDQAFQVRDLDEAEALLVRAEFLQSTRHEPEARPLVQKAQALAPERPETLLALGHGCVLRGEEEPARQALEAALQRGSRDFRAPYYLAILAQSRAGRGIGDSTRILEWLESARKLLPDFPGIHMALCQQYATEPRDPARVLEEGAAAIRLDPQNLAHRANLGIACMRLDAEQEARTIGGQLNQLARTQEEKRIAEGYALNLARYLELRQARAVAPQVKGVVSNGDPASPVVHAAPAPLRFSLPSYYTALGNEVIQLVNAGKTEEAIRKVDKAVAAAKYDYDRKSLRALLSMLRARIAKK